ncbi:DHA2 family efflux MFS transporter permease subunit [Alicyclobacillus fructus]|uniref:DHA2 family efflux MFS transporter permease subunit n=1 Tax=Alicyclobacillus fructus TaxID=2816082 RepID=UPI001A8C4D8F|nr:DHA2 family efflux MFS transporter permease subunit [Alicyclobacillus fructus]
MSNDSLQPTAGQAVVPASPNAPSHASSGEAAHGHPHRASIMIVMIFGAFIAILNQTLLNVALPHLMSAFNVDANTVQWLSTAYMLTNGVLIPITAFLMGTFTTRQLFISAMSLFLIGSFLCAIAPSFGVMVFGRIVQASGSAVMMPLLMTVILELFPANQRGRAMGTMAIAMFFAPAVGPTLSGWIVTNWSWRWLFWVVIPLAFIDIVMAVAVLRNVAKPVRPKLDVPGFLLSIVGFVCLLYGLSEAGSKGWGDTTVEISLIVGGVFLVFFILRELTAKEPMLDLRVFKYDIFTMTTIVGCIVNMAMFGAMILMPIYLQDIRGYTALQSGLMMLPGALLMGIMSPISGAIFDRVGARPLAVLGLAITTVTTWEFTKLNAQTGYGHIMLLYTLRMFGMSMLAMTVQTAGLNQLPRHLYRHGTSAANTARTVASSVGTAVLVTIMTDRTKVHYANFQNTVTLNNHYIATMYQTMVESFMVKLHSTMQAAQELARYALYGMAEQQSTIMGINDAFWWATWGSFLAFVLAFFIRRAKPVAAAAGAGGAVTVARAQAEAAPASQPAALHEGTAHEEGAVEHALEHDIQIADSVAEVEEVVDAEPEAGGAGESAEASEPPNEEETDTDSSTDIEDEPQPVK